MASKLYFDIFANDKTGQAFSSLQGRLDQSEKKLRAMRGQFLAVGAAAVAFGAAVFAAASRGAQQIDETAKAARRLDASIGGFRAIELAATEAGVSASVLTDNLQNINRELAKGGGATTDALNRLGLSARSLAGLDADEKIAVIADRVRDLGLSSGEATALLQGLGVRSREMVLLLQGGGDAIRSARSDVEAYGLALSNVDAARIEAANDAIGRLGLIGQYAAQQISLQLTPALGRMAEAMTNSLREGEALRTVIDFLADNVQRLLGYAVAFATFFGGRYIAALVAARVATFSLSGALLLLRTAIIRTGIGALIIGAAELVMWFGKLVRAAGSFGEALELLKNVAVEVFGRIKDAFGLIPMAVAAGSAAMRATFLTALQSMMQGFQDLTWSVANGLNSLFGLNLQGARISALEGMGTGSLARAITEAELAAGNARTAIGGFASSLTAPLASIGALRDAFRSVDDEVVDASDSLSAMDDALNDIGGAGGSARSAGSAMSAMGSAAEEAARLADAATKALQERITAGADAFASMFSSIVTGAKTAKQALSDLLMQMAEVQLRNAIMGFAGNGAGGAFGFLGSLLSPIPAFAGGTNSAPGGMALVGERGPELVNLPQGSQVHTAQATSRMLGGNTSRVVIAIDAGPEFAPRIASIAGPIAVEVVRENSRQMAQSQRRA